MHVIDDKDDNMDTATHLPREEVINSKHSR